ncbi:hypothetical protein RIF29_42162 [Crotalaria pallida]|uniref:Uncharacterized protein n=1 Tax=Crotalaria pallida TaxID=3830 RepID=A0AAN9E726_CROPI
MHASELLLRKSSYEEGKIIKSDGKGSRWKLTYCAFQNHSLTQTPKTIFLSVSWAAQAAFFSSSIPKPFSKTSHLSMSLLWVKTKEQENDGKNRSESSFDFDPTLWSEIKKQI